MKYHTEYTAPWSSWTKSIKEHSTEHAAQHFRPSREI